MENSGKLNPEMKSKASVCTLRRNKHTIKPRRDRAIQVKYILQLLKGYNKDKGVWGTLIKPWLTNIFICAIYLMAPLALKFKHDKYSISYF